MSFLSQAPAGDDRFRHSRRLGGRVPVAHRVRLLWTDVASSDASPARSHAGSAHQAMRAPNPRPRSLAATSDHEASVFVGPTSLAATSDHKTAAIQTISSLTATSDHETAAIQTISSLTATSDFNARPNRGTMAVSAP